MLLRLRRHLLVSKAPPSARTLLPTRDNQWKMALMSESESNTPRHLPVPSPTIRTGGRPTSRQHRLTTYAQQEPSIAVNPQNHLNVVAAQKDERSAPGPGTDTKEVWIETSTDGGLTWPVQRPIPMPDTTLPQQSDPVVTFSDNNTVYLTIIGWQRRRHRHRTRRWSPARPMAA